MWHSNKACSLSQSPLCLCDPTQLGSHSQLLRPVWPLPFPSAPMVAATLGPYLCTCAAMFAGTLGEKSKGQSPNPASNLIKPFPLVAATEEQPGCQPLGAGMKICSQELLRTLYHKGAHRFAWSACWSPCQIGWVSPREDRQGLGSIQVPKLELQSRTNGRL